MDLSYSAEHLAFRQEVRSFLQTEMPPALAEIASRDGHFEHHEVMQWHKILYKQGWVAPHWPVEYGGPGLDVTKRFLLSEELELAGAPILSPFGLYMVGPLLIQFGTEAQKARFLPKILSGEEVWCQGYSEPGSGSDLASVSLRAEDNGQGSFVLNGQKTWTTQAQYADWIFCLCRTDPKAKKQQGISFLLVDMKTPGLVARPMLTIAGTPGFCDTFFDNVVVPKENLVGPLNGGWTIAKALLGHERTLIAMAGVSARLLKRVKRLAKTTYRGDRPLFSDPAWRSKIAHVEILLRGLQMANYRTVANAQLGHAPGPESSILKLRGTEVYQKLNELAMEVIGHDGLSWYNQGAVPESAESVPPTYNYSRAATIYGGSNEIQKNILAKYILGLS